MRYLEMRRRAGPQGQSEAMGGDAFDVVFMKICLNVGICFVRKEEGSLQ
jgi:hypothetical protein